MELHLLAGNPFSPHDPYFFIGIAFLIFVAVVIWKGGKGILGTLDARSDKIRSELDEAQRLREEAQHLLADYKRRQREATDEAEGIIRQAEEEARRLREKAAKDLDETLARREQQAMDRIAQAEAQAAADVRNLAVDLAITATQQVLAKQLNEAKASELVDAAIKELPEKLH